MTTPVARDPHPADAVASALKRRDPRLAEAILEALSDFETADELDPEVWGPAPSEEAYLATVVRNHDRLADNRRQAISESLTRQEAARRLDVTPQQISRLVKSGDLVALEDGRELRLPEWQFHPDTPRGRLEGVRELQRAFSGGPVTLTQWVTRRNPALRGQTPAAALVRGRVARVLSAAGAAV